MTGPDLYLMDLYIKRYKYLLQTSGANISVPRKPRWRDFTPYERKQKQKQKEVQVENMTDLKEKFETYSQLTWVHRS